MARHFKKRKGFTGPNKNEEKVMRGEAAERRARSVGIMGPRFPLVKRLEIHLIFLNAQQHVLEERKLSLGPLDSCDLKAPCPGRCGVGAFDVFAIVETAVEAKHSQLESSLKGAEALFAGSTEKCGCELKAHLEMTYVPVAPADLPAPGDAQAAV